jgi:predicted Zn-dependent peptidase
MKKLFFATILLLVLPSVLFAQKKAEWKEAVSGGYSYRYVSGDPLEARFYSLQNGLTVITSVNKKEPRLQTIIATKAGSKTDPANHTGLAHYLEHMLFKGTEKYGTLNREKEMPLLQLIDDLYELYNKTAEQDSRARIYQQIDSVSGLAAKFAIANEYDNMMANLGAKGTNAFTWFEETAYINDVPSNKIEPWLKIEAERFRNPVFRIFHTELEAVYEEKNISLDSDDEKALDSLLGALFRRHNYGLQTTIGTVEHLKNPSLKEIRKYFETYYVPNNMVIILSGDFDPDAVVKSVDQHFAYMQPKPVPEYTFKSEENRTKPVEISVYGPESEYVMFGFRFPGAAHPQTEKLEILADLLSNGKAGLLDGLVTRGEVLSADAGAFILKDYSVLYFSGIPKEGQSLEQVKEMILTQVEKLKSGQFDEDLIKAIVNNNRRSEMQTAESNAGRAYDLLDEFITGKDRLQVVTADERKAKLTVSEMAAYAKTSLSDAPVIVYKRTGETSEANKVPKPPITPVEVNRDKESDFVKEIKAMKTADVNPVFPDFKKEITKDRVENNEVLAVKNSTNGLFSMYYVIPVGFRYTPLMRVLESYFGYAGTKNLSAEQFDKEMYKLAADMYVSVREDETWIGLSGLQENFVASFTLFQNKLNHLQADENILATLKQLMLKARNDEKMNPDRISSRLYSFGLYDGKNPVNDVFPDEELNAVKVGELTDLLNLLMNTGYRILYYGPQEMSDFISSLYSVRPVPASAPAPPAQVKMPEYRLRTLQKPEYMLVDFKKVQTDLIWVYNGEPFNASWIPTVALYNEYFGGGMSSVVFQEIRESKALAYSTFSTYAMPSLARHPFRFYAYIGCQADKMPEAINALEGLIARMPKSSGKFTAAKASLLNSISTSRITGINILTEYLRSERLGLDRPVNQIVAEKVPAITQTDMEKFQSEYIARKNRTLIIFGDMNTLDKRAIRKEDSDVRTVPLEEIFGY